MRRSPFREDTSARDLSQLDSEDRSTAMEVGSHALGSHTGIRLKPRLTLLPCPHQFTAREGLAERPAVWLAGARSEVAELFVDT